MIEEHFNQFFPTICAGLGLFLAGLVNLLLLRQGFAVRLPATLLALGTGIAAAWAIDQPGAVLGAAKLSVVTLLLLGLVSWQPVVQGMARVMTVVSRPMVRYGLLTVTGLGIAIGSVIIFERADEEATAQVINELELLQGQVETTTTERVKVQTDRGTPIVLKEPIAPRDESILTEAEYLILSRNNLTDYIIRRGPANDYANCHGWVFTGGHFQLGGSDVAVILKENDYQEIPEPRPGDLVVYRENGNISHTGIVRYVAAGQPVLVESKWGNLGIYIHPIDQSLYGTDYTIYRSPRTGHLLKGITPDDAPANLNTTKITTSE
jgi:hypothetical protein